MYLHRRPFWWPCRCIEAIRSASSDAAWPGLHRKPLHAAIGWLLTPYRPSGSQGNNQQNNVKMHPLCWPFRWTLQCGGTIPPASVIGHDIGGKYIPVMARLTKVRRWSKRWQTCLSSPDLTATHNEWWFKDPSTFTPRTTERSYDILRSESYESQ